MATMAARPGDRYGGAGDTYGSGGAGLWFPYGMTSPGAFHALMARRHMALYGTRNEHFGIVAKTFRDHAALNPAAVMRTSYTLADYHNSRYICEPLHLLDYCLINDGGVALLLTSAETGARSCSAARVPARLRHGDRAQRFDISTRRFLARAGSEGSSKKLPHGGAGAR